MKKYGKKWTLGSILQYRSSCCPNYIPVVYFPDVTAKKTCREKDEVENSVSVLLSACPVQEKLKKEISVLESELDSAKHARDSGLCRKNTVKRIAALDKKFIKKKETFGLEEKEGEA